jgi:hypothetical protein
MADIGKEYIDVAEVALANNDLQAAIYWMTKANVVSMRSLSWQLKLLNDRSGEVNER